MRLSQEEKIELGPSEIELSVVWFEVAKVSRELTHVEDVDGVVELFSSLVATGDERVRSVPIRFPVVLSMGLVPPFARSALWSLGVSSDGVAYVVFSTRDGKVWDLGVPSNFVEFVPSWKALPPSE